MTEPIHRRMEGRLGLSEILAGGASQIGQDIPGNLENAALQCGVPGNENAPLMNSPSGPAVTRRQCLACGKPLPEYRRIGTRYCVGGGCKQKAYRRRRKAEGAS
jgi:hypothetical protein